MVSTRENARLARGRTRSPEAAFGAAFAASLGLLGVTLGLVAGSPSALSAEFCVSCSGPAETYLCRLPDDLNAPRGTAGQLYCITELAKRGGHQACSVKRSVEPVACDGIEQVLAPPAGGTPPLPFDAPPSDTTAAGNADRSGPEPLMTPALQDPAPVQAPGDGMVPEVNSPPEDAVVSDEPLAADVETGGPIEEEAAAGPPKTVEEMAKRSLKTSKENLDAAGEAVGNTAKSAGKTVSNAAKKTGEQIGKVGSAVGSAAKKTWDCLSSLFSDC